MRRGRPVVTCWGPVFSLPSSRRRRRRFPVFHWERTSYCRRAFFLVVRLRVLMATNRIDILDQALLGPGRIDRKIEFPNPNEESRLDILKIHSRRMNLMRGIDLKEIAEKMISASGAELKAVCTEAGMFAMRERRVHVTQEDFKIAVVMSRNS
ncbi:hypothetical protein MRB53_026261 [Persea americana]|uniref:Uncharacterized protein n=1 Tax=Persea americana TaxID=3435 RepID=A0ACC2LHH8_PERAE|nr:hypothetical protein MRB53_026261 [Persea americana]